MWEIQGQDLLNNLDDKLRRSSTKLDDYNLFLEKNAIPRPPKKQLWEGYEVVLWCTDRYSTYMYVWRDDTSDTFDESLRV